MYLIDHEERVDLLFKDQGQTQVDVEKLTESFYCEPNAPIKVVDI